MNEQQMIQAYQKHLTEDGKGTKTVISYAGDVKGLLKWLGDKKVVFEGQLTRFYITSYKDDLIKNTYTINTINKKINSPTVCTASTYFSSVRASVMSKRSILIKIRLKWQQGAREK